MKAIASIIGFFRSFFTKGNKETETQKASMSSKSIDDMDGHELSLALSNAVEDSREKMKDPEFRKKFFHSRRVLLQSQWKTEKENRPKYRNGEQVFYG